MDEHDLYVERGFCPAIYADRWCRLPADHDDKHVSVWEMAFPGQEKWVRWNGDTTETATDVGWLVWKADPPEASWW